MNRLILLGNGFDLAHDLPTSYGDFIFNHTKEEIRRCLNLEEYKNFKPLFNLTRISNPNLKRKNISLSDSLLQIKSKNDLVEFVRSCFTLNEENHPADINRGEIKCINYKNQFAKDLVSESNGDKWSDIESFFYEKLIFESQIEKKQNEYQKNRYIKDVKRLNDGFDKAKSALIFYLTEQIENKYIFEAKEEFIDILNGNGDIESTLFLNFNYTSTAEEYLPLLQKTNKTDLIHIHGNLKSNDNSIIFGYGNESDKYYKLLEDYNEDSVFQYFKSFGYLKNTNYKKLNAFLESSQFEIYLIGHSCGLSDSTLLKNLFEHEHCKSIKIFYHKDFENYNKITTQISKHFSDKTKWFHKIEPFNENDFCPQVKLKKKV